MLAAQHAMPRRQDIDDARCTASAANVANVTCGVPEVGSVAENATGADLVHVRREPDTVVLVLSEFRGTWI